jgi:hypothetical protein
LLSVNPTPPPAGAGLKLNLGSGQNPLPGFLNVDKFGNPDLKWDLEVFPWPWQTSSVTEIVLKHVLEHLGQSADTYLGIFKELYRVCQPGAVIHITVPHPRHDDFLGDPTHVRPVTPQSLTLLSKRLNRLFAEQKAANTPLAFYLDVDFELEGLQYDLDEPWRSQLKSGQISAEQVTEQAQRYNNVIKQISMRLRTVKA